MKLCLFYASDLLIERTVRQNTVMDQYSLLSKSCAGYNLLNFSLCNFLQSPGASCLFVQVFSEPILKHSAIIFLLYHVILQVKIIFFCTVLYE